MEIITVKENRLFKNIFKKSKNIPLKAKTKLLKKQKLNIKEKENRNPHGNLIYDICRNSSMKKNTKILQMKE